MSKPENLYSSLLRKTDNALQNEGEVKAIVSELIPTRSSADKSLKNMKAVFLDAANVPTDKLHKRKKTKRQQLRDRPLNARERRTLKVYDVPRDIRYEWFIPLHNLWQGYMKDLYGQGPDIQQFAQKLLKADFHGSILTEIPKAGAVFTMQMDACPSIFTLYGHQLLCRAADRAARKFKSKPTIDL